MSTHLTLMPVCRVKSASAALGREPVASATVIVTPFVLLDASGLLPELPPPQAASVRARAAAAPVAAPRPRRPRVLLLSVLANAPLLRYAAIAGRGTRGMCAVNCAIICSFVSKL